jgi:hypothetical protein
MSTMWNYQYDQAAGNKLISEYSDTAPTPVGLPANIKTFSRAQRLDPVTEQWDTVTATIKPKSAPVDPLATLKAKTSATWTLADIADWLKTKG